MTEFTHGIQNALKKLTKKVDNLETKLSKHIHFIEQIYGPLQKSIEKFKRYFK